MLVLKHFWLHFLSYAHDLESLHTLIYDLKDRWWKLKYFISWYPVWSESNLTLCRCFRKSFSQKTQVVIHIDNWPLHCSIPVRFFFACRLNGYLIWTSLCQKNQALFVQALHFRDSIWKNCNTDNRVIQFLEAFRR